MNKQFVKKIIISKAGEKISFDHTLPTDFNKVVGVLIETSNDPLAQQDTMDLNCNNEPIINNYPDGDGVSSRILRYDQNAQFPIKDSIWTLNIDNAANKHMKGSYKNNNTTNTGFEPYWVKFYYFSN